MNPDQRETPSPRVNNFLEEATGRVKLKRTLQKVFTGFVILGCLSLALILAILVGLKNDDETKTSV